MLALAPRMVEVITEMWDKSAMGQGWQFVSKAVEIKFLTPFGNLSKEVYAEYNKSKGSKVTLKELINKYKPHQTTPPPTPQTTKIPLEGPNSSTNQAPSPNDVAGGGREGDTGGGSGVVGGVAEGVVDVFTAAQKLTDEQAISTLESEPGIDLSCWQPRGSPSGTRHVVEHAVGSPSERCWEAVESGSLHKAQF